jgi:hypothetical protein
LSAASAATAPFTLAKVPRQIAQFWLFDANAGDAASDASARPRRPPACRGIRTWLNASIGSLDRDGLCGAGGTGLGAAGPVSASGVLADTLGRHPQLASVAPPWRSGRSIRREIHRSRRQS